MTPIRWFPALFLGLCAPALAGANLSIPLEDGPETSIITASYACGGGAPFEVQYINAGENSLALIPIEGKQRVFVQTISASGARYLSGGYEWWSKGDTATLSDSMSEAPAQDCAEIAPAAK